MPGLQTSAKHTRPKPTSKKLCSARLSLTGMHTGPRPVRYNPRNRLSSDAAKACRIAGCAGCLAIYIDLQEVAAQVGRRVPSDFLERPHLAAG